MTTFPASLLITTFMGKTKAAPEGKPTPQTKPCGQEAFLAFAANSWLNELPKFMIGDVVSVCGLQGYWIVTSVSQDEAVPGCCWEYRFCRSDSLAYNAMRPYQEHELTLVYRPTDADIDDAKRMRK